MMAGEKGKPLEKGKDRIEERKVNPQENSRTFRTKGNVRWKGDLPLTQPSVLRKKKGEKMISWFFRKGKASAASEDEGRTSKHKEGGLRNMAGVTKKTVAVKRRKARK